MIYFLFSADHEIFFGENYKTEKELLVDTTYKLMNLLMEYEIPISLMTDVCSVFKYRELGLYEYPKIMEEQLKYAISNNHDVQLHLHPHWVNSFYKDGIWRFNKDKYKLHDFGFYNQDDLITGNYIVKKGKEYLENLLMPINSNYRCVAFRAGGWCLQPERDLIQCLLENNIKIDTTIYKGGHIKSETHFLDYRDVPKEINWFISPSRGLKYKSDTGIFEIPIGSIFDKPQIYYKKLINKSNRKRYLKQSVNGVPINFERQTLLCKLKSKIRNFINQPIMFSFDNSTSTEMIDFTKYYLNYLDYRNNDYYISIIGHPKVINDSNLIEIDKYCKEVKKKYINEVKFTNYLEVSNKIFLGKR